jgi:quinol-cytochrome oxidoreductase complex cytochrome b subunit
MRFIHITPFAILNDHLIDYPTAIATPYTSSFGSLAGVCLSIQIVSGILLVMHYTPNVQYAFDSIEHIMRNVNDGWLIRYTHSNGASIFFIIIYLHIFRHESSSSYPGILMTISGLIIFLLLMATAFMGYILPWGQMSFWGATVITNLFAAIPCIGDYIAEWLWGGFSVDNPTLTRFFSLHYLLPFVLAAVVFLHLLLLHTSGSAGDEDVDDIDFYPYFYLKDLFATLILLSIFCVLVFFVPNYLGHPDNYIKANSLVTPIHLVPEWYFLPYYAILRSTPDKFGGFIAMIFGIIMMFDLDDEDDEQGLILTILLGYLGGKPIEEPYMLITQLISILPVIDYMFEDAEEEENEFKIIKC